jgi:septum formation topological specificity factor MinE
MYNLEEMYVDILDTIMKNVQSRRDDFSLLCPVYLHASLLDCTFFVIVSSISTCISSRLYMFRYCEEMYVDILDTIMKNVQSRRDACRYTGHNNEKCII